MASTRNRNKYNNRRKQSYTGYYEEGSAVRRLEEVPEQPKKELSRRANPGNCPEKCSGCQGTEVKSAERR